MAKLFKNNIVFRYFSSILLIFSFLLWMSQDAFLYAQGVWNLPVPGVLVDAGPVYAPVNLHGVIVHPDDPFRFNFLVDTGDDDLSGKAFYDESRKLIKYFLAAITIPDDDFWVNLSPEESQRIIPSGLGKTELGMEMLAQDYFLKQITSSLMFPESDMGKTFWKKVFAKAQKLYGTANIPVDTFNKVWIVPDKAVVYEDGPVAVVQSRHLKVMLEEDYRMEENSLLSKRSDNEHDRTSDAVAREIIREIIIPELEYEVNNSEAFAPVRQIYNAAILAQWFKKRLKDSLLGAVYMDQNKTLGINVKDPGLSQKIYDQYLEAFQKGVYNFIKEDQDPAASTIIPRKYFSGGLVKPEITTTDASQLSASDRSRLTVPESQRGGSGSGSLRDVGVVLTAETPEAVDEIQNSSGNDTALAALLAASSAALRLRGALDQPVGEIVSDRSMLSFDLLDFLSSIPEFMTTWPDWAQVADFQFEAFMQAEGFVLSWFLAGMTAKWMVKKFFQSRWLKTAFNYVTTQTVFANRWALSSGDSRDAERAGEFFLARAGSLSPQMVDQVLELFNNRVEDRSEVAFVPILSSFYQAIDREPEHLIKILKSRALFDSSPSREIAIAIIRALENSPNSLLVDQALEEIVTSEYVLPNAVKEEAQRVLNEMRAKVVSADQTPEEAEALQEPVTDTAQQDSDASGLADRDAVGGIDFRLSALKVEVKRDAQGKPLPVVQQSPDLLNIQGFTPVIIQVVPANMNLILGTNNETASSWPRGVLKQS